MRGQMPPAEDFETKKRSNWFTWWHIEPEELQRQVSQYHTLKLYQSARGISVLFLLLSAAITAIFVSTNLAGYTDISYIDAGIAVFLAVFILLGHRWAMLVAMVFWTIEKGNQIYTVFDAPKPQAFNVIIAVVWWTVYMHAFYLAFRTEQARRPSRDVATEEAIAPAPEVSTRKSGLIISLWNGDVSLAKAYWLYGFLGGIILRLLSPWLTYLLTANADNLSRFDEAIIRYAWSALLISYSVLIFVAIWKSATKSIKRNPKGSVWAYLAKVAVVFGGIAGIAGIAASFSPTAIQDSMNSNTVDHKMQVEAMIAGLNANLPKKLDAISSMTKIDFRNNSFIYYINSERRIANKQDFYNRMREQLMSACTNNDLISLIKSNLDLTYIYSDPDTPNAATIVISKADCPNL